MLREDPTVLHHSLQQESYHEPETPNVEYMVSTGRATAIQAAALINDQREGITHMREALTVWSTRHGEAN